MATEVYLNAATGKPDLPSYERWYKWTKYSLNIATAVLGLGVKLVGGAALTANETTDTLFDVVLFIRCLEIVKDTIPLVRPKKDPTAEHNGFVTVLWFKRCCARHEGAEKVDKWFKYISSVVVSLALCVLAFCMLSHAFNLGLLLLACVSGADFAAGAYALVLDEIIKDWRLIRTKPYQMELDDALALTDDDALAKDMFTRLSATRNDGRSYYMEASSGVQMLHDLKVEGQWLRPKEDRTEGTTAGVYRTSDVENAHPASLTQVTDGRDKQQQESKKRQHMKEEICIVA